jgi:hypothetical protein
MLYSSSHPVYANWNTTQIWNFDGTSLPKLNFNQSSTPVASHVCSGSAAAISRTFNCIINVADSDLNEIRAISYSTDHNCWWLSANSLLLTGAPTISDSSSCRASFTVTDGNQNSTQQSFDIQVRAGVSSSPLNFPPKYSYGTRATGSNTPVSFTITNHEAVTITGFNVNLGGSSQFIFNGGSYRGSTGNCGSSLNADSSCNVQISFTPLSIGTYDHHFEVQYSIGAESFKQHFYLIGYAN